LQDVPGGHSELCPGAYVLNPSGHSPHWLLGGALPPYVQEGPGCVWLAPTGFIAGIALLAPADEPWVQPVVTALMQTVPADCCGTFDPNAGLVPEDDCTQPLLSNVFSDPMHALPLLLWPGAVQMPPTKICP
jgi:hypothetical protein